MNDISTIDAITQLLFIPDIIPDVADVCIVLGNDYVDTMKTAKFVYDNGISDKFILTGHSARKDKEPECDRFFKRGVELGIPPEKMLLENKATNSYQNLQFSGQIIREQLGGFENCRKILFIAKAFVTRRIEMTAKKNILNLFKPFFVQLLMILKRERISKWIIGGKTMLQRKESLRNWRESQNIH